MSLFMVFTVIEAIGVKIPQEILDDARIHARAYMEEDGKITLETLAAAIVFERERCAEIAGSFDVGLAFGTEDEKENFNAAVSACKTHVEALIRGTK